MVIRGTIKVRPNGTKFDYGATFQPNSESQAGIFRDNVFLMPQELKFGSTDDFLDMSYDIESLKFGPRYLKYSDNYEEHGFGYRNTYIGEWSSETNKPHGRGIIIDNNSIYISYFNNCVWTGKFINISKVGEFWVGENTRDANGDRKTKVMQYNVDGTSEQIDY